MNVQQPHFDDERTVLSARPVVPLQVIEAKVKHRRRWVLGGAFAIAMFLGAASALVSAYFKLRNQPAADIQPSAVVSVPEPVAEPSLETPLPAVVPTPEETEEQPVVKVVRPKRQLPPVRQSDQSRVSEDESLRQIRSSVLIDQWEERRARRVERRERRRAQHHDRDLSNIDEIFEGRRRP